MTHPTIDWSLFENYEVAIGFPVFVTIDPCILVGDPSGACQETLTFIPDIEEFPWISVNNRDITVYSSDFGLSD